MIQGSIFKIAQAHADSLQIATGMAIVPAGNSPLSALVSLSNVSGISAGDQASLVEALQAATDDTSESPSLHTAAVAAQIEYLIPLAASHIDYIQNTVCPKVEDFCNSMQRVITRLDAESPMSFFNIIQVSAPAPLENQDLKQMVSDYSDPGRGFPNAMQTLPSCDASQLREFMRVSSSSVNNSIDEWLAGMGDEWLVSTYSRFFCYGGDNMGFRILETMSVFDQLNTALALFLLSRGMMGEPMEDAGMSLADWRSGMDHVSRYAASRVEAATRSMKSVLSAETLILGVKGKTITVHAPVYLRFLEEGGRIEDVLGAALSNRSPTYGMLSMREDGDAFRKVWTNYQAMGQLTLNAAATTALRNEAKALLVESYVQVSENEAEALEVLGRSKETQITKGSDAIDSLTLKDLRDVNTLALKIIAGIRFSHTPALQFLTDMCEAEEAGCTNPAEAAAVATVNYISDYMAGNMGLMAA